MDRPRILFVCAEKGARSALAEAWARRLAGDRAVAASAAFDPGLLPPFVHELIEEADLELASPEPAPLFQAFRSGEDFTEVVSLCGEQRHCDRFETSVDALYGQTARRHSWAVPTLSTLAGSPEEKREAARGIRERIRVEVERLLEELGVLGADSAA